MKGDVATNEEAKGSILARSRLEILQVYKLLQCVRQEDRIQITKLCAQGVPMLINYCDPNHGETALHLAAQFNNDSMTLFLLSLGAQPNVQDFKGRTPIMRAADYGHDKTVEVLAEAGSDMLIKDNQSQDILAYCLSSSTKRHRLCLDIALTFGADPNNTFDSTIPTLVTACESAIEHENMCLMLLEKGANPNAIHKGTGKSALSAACTSGNAVIVRELLKKGANTNVPDKNLITPIHYAAHKGVIEIVKSLAAYGANLTSIDRYFCNALHFAAERGFGMVCKYLAQRGCNPNQKNSDLFTPRLLAKEKSFKEASKELRKAEKTFKKYSKPGMKNPNEPEVLYLYDWTCERADTIREMLLQLALPATEGIKTKLVARQDFENVMTQLNAPIPPHMNKRLLELHDKDRKGVVDIEEFLSGKKYISKAYLMSAFEGKKKKKGKKGKKGRKGKKGKKFKAPMPICTNKEGPRRPDGGPPYNYVEKQALWTDRSRFSRDNPPDHPLQDDSAWYLQQPDKQYTEIMNAVRADDLKTLQKAFDSGTEVDIRDKYFKTPLMVSCAEGNLRLTKYLLSMNADIHAQDNFKWTPLHHACHSGQLDVVKELLYAGAEGNGVTWNGATPLMRAIESGKTDVVKFLLDCNVNMIMVNKKEKTAVDIARDWGDTAIYIMVKEKYDAAPKPKKDKNGKMKIPPVRPLTLPPRHELNLTSLSIAEAEEHPLMENGQQNLAKNQQLLKPSTPVNEEGSHFKRSNSFTDRALDMFGKTKKESMEDIVYTPRKAWVEQVSTEEILKDKQEKRNRYGDEIDFENYEKALKQNITTKIKEFQSAQT